MNTGSLVNDLLSWTEGEPTPVVGMGATILCWTDRHAATIVKVTRCQVHVQRDKATRVDRCGLSEVQLYSYQSDATAPVQVFRKNKNGRWRETGGGDFLRIGSRHEYHDYSF